MIFIDRDTGIRAIFGGLFLGGGGGGSLEGGLEVLEKTLKFGDLKLFDIEDFCDEGVILTASLVGSPASMDKYVGDKHYKEVYDLYKKVFEGEIAGIITNEMGAQSITNGWLLSAMTNIPYIDAPCNGRAHPTGAMGSMGLSSDENYITIQAAAGGKGERDISILTKGSLKSTSDMVRKASIEAGGFVTVLRNPVSVEYIKKNTAINSIKKAIEIGGVFIENVCKPNNVLDELSEVIDMEIICKGKITQFSLETKDGFDLGLLNIEDSDNQYEIVFWNEYMTIDNREGMRIATFPDLIAVLDANTGLPIISADLKRNLEVILVKVSKDDLVLGKSMYDMNLLNDTEKIIERDLVKYF